MLGMGGFGRRCVISAVVCHLCRGYAVAQVSTGIASGVRGNGL